MAEFSQIDLGGSVFDRVDLSGATFHNVDLSRVVMKDVDLIDVEITASVENLRINGVDVGPLIDAELDRRYPLRERCAPTTPKGSAKPGTYSSACGRERWIESPRLPPDQLHESINGEWSFIQTLRHLTFATDSWVRRAILGNPSPWDSLGLPWSEMPDTPGVPNDRACSPRSTPSSRYAATGCPACARSSVSLTDESLAGHTQAVEGPGWPESRSYPVRQCLRIVLNEEWEHRLYAERDLDVLFAPKPLRAVARARLTPPVTHQAPRADPSQRARPDRQCLGDRDLRASSCSRQYRPGWRSRGS